MATVPLQTYLKQTFFVTLPSLAEGLSPSSKPGLTVPQAFMAGQEVRIVVPASFVKRYQLGESSLSHKVPGVK